MSKFQTITEIEKLNKETLVKIIHLFNHTNKKNIFETLYEIYINADETEKEIIESRINSIMSDINRVKYLKKVIFPTYTIYFYEKSIDIYPNEFYNSDGITKEIKQLKYEQIFIHIKNSKKIFEISNIDTLEEKIKNHKPENIKIKTTLA